MQDIGTYSYDFYDEPLPQGWLRRHAGHLVLAFGIITTLVATVVIAIHSEALSLSGIYLLACAVCFVFLFMTRKDILSPIGIATIWYIIGFLLSVPFYTASAKLESVTLNGSEFTQTVALSLLGLLSFAIGSVSGFDILFRPVFNLMVRTRGSLRPVGHCQFVFMLIWLVIGAAIRLTFSVGRATQLSTIGVGNVTGIIQFLFNEGSLFLMGLFLYRALERSKVFLIEGYLLLIGYAATQILLGWKSSILLAFVLYVTLLWYQKGEQRRRSLMWALIMVVFIPITMQLGYAVRAQETGVAKEYAKGSMDFVLKLVTRMDGNVRFAKVLAYETGGQGLSLTNGFKIISLVRTRATVVEYTDLYVHGIAIERKTSTGSSGPGGAYIGLGVLGIILGYFTLGALYRGVYKQVKNLSAPSLAVVLYGFMAYTLSEFIGNFFITRHVKQLVVITLVLILARYFLRGEYSEDLQYSDHY